jgi:hypothetical protein
MRLSLSCKCHFQVPSKLATRREKRRECTRLEQLASSLPHRQKRTRVQFSQIERVDSLSRFSDYDPLGSARPPRSPSDGSQSPHQTRQRPQVQALPQVRQDRPHAEALQDVPSPAEEVVDAERSALAATSRGDPQKSTSQTPACTSLRSGFSAARCNAMLLSVPGGRHTKMHPGCGSEQPGCRSSRPSFLLPTVEVNGQPA